ncbi:hypothetical protein QO014_003329 [Kaistia dalseonensis]|uniref:Uncharacterized protein n=1 Tax=Kaistia dalseonensis TaxID=410840 RepID=A0ABU0H9E1_9HYPH|nr:hypothetical protein [Kaistia dalseonensis]
MPFIRIEFGAARVLRPAKAPLSNSPPQGGRGLAERVTVVRAKAPSHSSPFVGEARRGERRGRIPSFRIDFGAARVPCLAKAPLSNCPPQGGRGQAERVIVARARALSHPSPLVGEVRRGERRGRMRSIRIDFGAARVLRPAKAPLSNSPPQGGRELAERVTVVRAKAPSHSSPLVGEVRRGERRGRMRSIRIDFGAARVLCRAKGPLSNSPPQGGRGLAERVIEGEARLA